MNKPPGIYDFAFDKVVEVDVTDIDIVWDLYWSQGGSSTLAKLKKTNSLLTLAAKRAIENNDPSIFWNAQEKYEKYGAGDTEVSNQFEVLWKEARGWK